MAKDYSDDEMGLRRRSSPSTKNRSYDHSPHHNPKPFYSQRKPNNNFYNNQNQRPKPLHFNYQGQRKPFAPPRKFHQNYSKNYKVEADRQHKLPPFTFNNNNRHRNNYSSDNILGYRDPKYNSNNNRSKKYFKPQNENNSDYERSEIISPNSNENDFDFSNVSMISTPKHFDLSTEAFSADQVVSDHSACEEKIISNDNRLESSYFQIKLVDSYKEFCQIKCKSTINLKSKYETISFLKELLPKPRQPIILFFDKVERVFYGAAVICLDEFSEREEIETFTIESLSLKLNWIFLSEVDETSLNFQVNVSEEYEHLDPEKGLQVLSSMEEFETRLHDVKKIQPIQLRLKRSRLEELEEFFRLTDERITETETACGPMLEDFELDNKEIDLFKGTEFEAFNAKHTETMSMTDITGAIPAEKTDENDDFFDDYFYF